MKRTPTEPARPEKVLCDVCGAHEPLWDLDGDLLCEQCLEDEGEVGNA